MTDESAVSTMILVPLMMAVLEAIKRAGVPGKFIPLIALILGAAGGLLWALRRLVVDGDTLFTGLIHGMIVGMSAVGLYSTHEAFEGEKRDTRSGRVKPPGAH